MRKIIFTLVLTIVISVWTLSEANWCMPSVRTSTETVIKVAGIFQVDGAPCEPNGACPNCLTIVFATSDKTYYLVTDEGKLIERLDTIPLGATAVITGIPFTRGNEDYLQVRSIEMSDQDSISTEERIKKLLLGQWTVYKEEVDGVYYNGQDDFRWVFMDSTVYEECSTCYSAPARYTVKATGSGKWILTVEGMFDAHSPSDPSNTSVIFIHKLIGDVMEWSYMVYGDEGEATVYFQHLKRVGTEGQDTIPLYAEDDSGSSTVDPVDPNQIIVTLKGSELTIRENTGADITYSLHRNAPAKAPAQQSEPDTDTFRDVVKLPINESGEYQLKLTNPSWGYTLYGTFYYAPQGIEQISSSSQQEIKAGRLILLNGQLFILRGEKVYTITGQELK